MSAQDFRKSGEHRHLKNIKIILWSCCKGVLRIKFIRLIILYIIPGPWAIHIPEAAILKKKIYILNMQAILIRKTILINDGLVRPGFSCGVVKSFTYSILFVQYI